jgi:hypothetical protein
MSGGLVDWNDLDRLGQDGADGDLLPVLLHKQGSSRQALNTLDELSLVEAQPYQLGFRSTVRNFNDANALSPTDRTE